VLYFIFAPAVPFFSLTLLRFILFSLILPCCAVFLTYAAAFYFIFAYPAVLFFSLTLLCFILFSLNPNSCLIFS